MRESVLIAKRRLTEEREKLEKQHHSGSPGIQVCARLSDFLDSTILKLFEDALDEVQAEHAAFIHSNVALVPQGGYGRRDVAPFSDVDLMLLHDPVVEPELEKLARRLVTDVSDLGLQLGFSVRTIKQACQFAKRDPVVFTSQVESRYLGGSVPLYSKFMRRFRRTAKRGQNATMQRVIQARRTERSQYDQTVFLLQPDLKRSVGALRDIHLLRWIGFARYGESNPASLRLLGFLQEDDERALRRAHEFLLRLRNELHFHAGRSSDVLRRAEQIRVAEAWGYEGSQALLPVEKFMQEYFDHTCSVRDILNFFIAKARRRPLTTVLLGHLVSHQMDGLYRVGPVHIGANARGLARLRGNLAEVLRLMELANQSNKRITHDTWTAIREDMIQRDHITVSLEAARRFMSLLNYTARLGSLLRRLHELRVLEKLIAGMDHARHLLQFNEYHKYTVDEHCIRSVERATEFFSDRGPLGHAYRKIKRRSLLHLALLVHDIGKGLPEDHSEVGMRLAGETAARLKLSRTETEILEFLVLHHLKMSHLAFRRDTSDEAIVIQFAQEVGSPEVLRMLFVLTAADLAAVGPEVLNPWKVEVLWQLYQRAMFHLGGGKTSTRSEELAIKRRLELEHLLPGTKEQWFISQIRALPDTYVLDNDLAAIVDDLQRLKRLEEGRASAWGRYLDDREVCDYSIGLREPITPGAFHRMAGVISSKGLSILSGSLHTLSDGLVLYRFHVEDDDFDGQPPQERMAEISQALTDCLENPSDAPPTFRKVWGQSSDPDKELQRLATRIVVDNSTLHDFTIIDIFTHDRTGLIYQISRTLHELELEICFAKIGTYLDQVVDVFYVTDRYGNKIEGDERIELVRSTLLEAVENG